MIHYSHRTRQQHVLYIRCQVGLNASISKCTWKRKYVPLLCNGNNTTCGTKSDGHIETSLLSYMLDVAKPRSCRNIAEADLQNRNIERG